MHKLEHITGQYMELSVEAHDAFQYIKQYHVDADLLVPVQNRLEKNIIVSIENLSHSSLSLNNVAREIVDYVSTLKQASMKYLDVIEKQRNLIVDSVTPLIKANKTFIEIYGKGKFQELDNTPVKYFDRVSNHPIPVLNGLADAIIRHNPDDIRVSCKELLNCHVSDGQLEYPSLGRLTAVSNETLKTLGYTATTFDQELQGLTGEKGTSPYLKLVQKKQDIIKHLNTQADNITTDLKLIRPGRKDFKKQVRDIMQEVGDLQCYNVALSSVMFLLQSASFSAYEAGYQIHLAELTYQKY